MKKLLFFVAIIATVFLNKSFAQDNAQQNQLTQLLTQYYGIKDALVAGNSSKAAASAGQFIKILNSIDYKVISEGNVNALLKDVTLISEAKDIDKQRNQFANFSDNMATLAKTVKLSPQPIYQVYCPMKKVNWLSNSKEVKNPFYGSAMLTCGQVVDTIQ